MDKDTEDRDTEDRDIAAQLAAIRSDLATLARIVAQQVTAPSTPLLLKRLACEDSARYIYDTFPEVQVFPHRQGTLAHAVRAARGATGLFVEFGVHKGASITRIATLCPDRTIHGFDSFRGLPEDWAGTDHLAGHFDEKGALPKVPANVVLHPGWFQQSIPAWKAAHPGPIALCHIDCDLYSSTVTIFTELEDRFRPGTILLFDEYFGYPGWRHGEHKAFHEMLARTGFAYTARAVSHMGLVVELGARG